MQSAHRWRRSPKVQASRHDDRKCARPAPAQETPRLSDTSFPVGALPSPAGAVVAVLATGPRPRPGATRQAARW